MDLYVIEEYESGGWAVGLIGFGGDDVGANRQQKMKNEMPMCPKENLKIGNRSDDELTLGRIHRLDEETHTDEGRNMKEEQWSSKTGNWADCFDLWSGPTAP